LERNRLFSEERAGRNHFSEGVRTFFEIYLDILHIVKYSYRHDSFGSLLLLMPPPRVPARAGTPFPLSAPSSINNYHEKISRLPPSSLVQRHPPQRSLARVHQSRALHAKKHPPQSPQGKVAPPPGSPPRSSWPALVLQPHHRTPFPAQFHARHPPRRLSHRTRRTSFSSALIRTAPAG